MVYCDRFVDKPGHNVSSNEVELDYIEQMFCCQEEDERDYNGVQTGQHNGVPGATRTRDPLLRRSGHDFSGFYRILASKIPRIRHLNLKSQEVAVFLLHNFLLD